MTEAAMSALAVLDDEVRAAAYEGIFQEVYGERWEVYKEATGFGDFSAWQSKIALIRDEPNEARAIELARDRP